MERITVMYRVDGTTKKDVFTARECLSQMMSAGRAILTLVDGLDVKDGTPVRVVQYRRVERILRAPNQDDTP